MQTSFLTYLRCVLAILFVSMASLCRVSAGEVADGDGAVMELPQIRITYAAEAFNSKTFIPAALVYEEGDSVCSFSCAVRHRGALSLNYAKPNFALKFQDENGEPMDVRFLGMRKDNNWILDAMAIDRARMRNRVSMDLWLDFSRPPYHQGLEPKAVNGYRGRFVEVFANGDYLGLYCLMERLDRKQLKLKKFVEAREEVDSAGNVTRVPAYHRGLLYKAIDGNGTRTPYLLWQTEPPTPGSYAYDGVEAAYPDAKDHEPFDWNPIRDNIYYMGTHFGQTFRNKIRSLFDVPVLIDYVLFVDLLYAIDNVGKNVYFWFYDQSSADQRLGVTPWDIDAAWGRNFVGGRVGAGQAMETRSNFDSRFMKVYSGYADTLCVRYAVLRDSLWSEANLYGYFDRYFSLFQQTGVWEREQRRWAGTDSKVTALADEQYYIHQWIRQRLAFLDEQYGYVSASIDAVPAPAPVPSVDYDLMGRRRVSEGQKGMSIGRNQKKWQP